MKTLAKTLMNSALAVGLSAALVAPAFAAAPLEDNAARPTIQVRVADLDLGTAAGQRTLDTRVESAIRRVCRPANIKSGLRLMDETAQACKARARAEARSQVAALMNDTRRGG